MTRIFFKVRGQFTNPTDQDPFLQIGIKYISLLIPSSWFFGYQYNRGNLVIAVIPPFALMIDFAAIRHRLTCGICYGAKP